MITRKIWGHGPHNEPIYRYTITNAGGASVVLTNIGAGVVSINVPDRNGKLGDVVLGYGKPESYFNDGPCAGKCPGRYANRIADGKFTLDGRKYSLPINNGPNHLHGGPEGFQNKVWLSHKHKGGVEFYLFSPDDEMGYPGNLRVKARYEWTDKCELRLTFTAKSDADTIVNLTNHSYFNLNCGGSVLRHTLKLNASNYLPTDETLIPTGEIASVAGTPMNFLKGKSLGRDIKKNFPALNYGKGYDACWVLDSFVPGKMVLAAELSSKKTCRGLRVYTTQPGVQVYTGNWLGGCPSGKRGRKYHDYDAVAIECQHFPDSPNHPSFPDTTLKSGKTFSEVIVFEFYLTESL